MQVKVKKEGFNPSFSIIGRFDAHEVDTFRNEISSILDEPNAVVHADLSQVVFMDSTALAELVRVMKHVRSAGSDLVLVALSAPARVILELTRLDRAFTISQTIQLETTELHDQPA